MSDLQYLGQEIRQRLESAEEKGRLLQKELQTKMTEMEKRYAKFEQPAAEIMTDVIDPRMDRLVSFFDNAKLLERDDAGRLCCVSQFDHSARFPASVKLTLSVVCGSAKVLPRQKWNTPAIRSISVRKAVMMLL